MAGLCGAEAAGPPTADLLRPPTDLLAHPQQQQRRPGSATDGDGSGSSNGIGSSNGGSNGGSNGTSNSTSGPDVPANGGGPPAGLNLPSPAGIDLPSKGNQVLVLLDMNGTLLYRAKKPLRAAASGDGSEAAAAVATAAAVSFVHGDPVPLQYYMRPGAAQLVAAMHRHSRVRLAFYTSMRGVNALPAARFLMPGDGHG